MKCVEGLAWTLAQPECPVNIELFGLSPIPWSPSKLEESHLVPGNITSGDKIMRLFFKTISCLMSGEKMKLGLS